MCNAVVATDSGSAKAIRTRLLQENGDLATDANTTGNGTSLR